MTKNPPPFYDQSQDQPPYGGYQSQMPYNQPYHPNPHQPGNQYPVPTYDGAPPQDSCPPQNYGSPYGAEAPTYGAAASYYSDAPPVNQNPNANVSPDAQERGVMGALAGAAAGGYAGHKMNHGIIGTLGGAYAGHKLQDVWKDHHNKPSVPSPSHSPAPPAGPPPAYSHMVAPTSDLRGNFSASSGRMSLDRDYDLIAECRAISGEMRMSSVSLNRYLGNDDGRFVWVVDGGNFGASARSVRLIEDGKVLEAELRDRNGGWHWARVRLDERVGNNDGELIFVA